MLDNQILRCVEIGTTMAKMNYFYYRFITLSQIQIPDSFDREKQIKWLQSVTKFVGKIEVNFFNRRCPRRRRRGFLNSLIQRILKAS